MLTQYQLTLSPDREAKLTSETAYRLYSALLRKCPEEFGNSSHNGDRVSLSQYAVPLDNGKLLWNVSLFGESCEKLVSPVLDSLESLYLRWEGCKAVVTDKKIFRIENLEDMFSFPENYGKIHRLEFLTPAAFKSQGKYICLPSIRLIVQSLIRSWNGNFPQYQMNDENGEITETLSSGLFVQNFSIHTQAFQLKKNSINGFTGSITLINELSEDAAELADLLLAYSQFAGIGIKTTLGMGGVMNII